ncbi:MAG: IclR family transcriptional regulator [Opitutales bacterium]|nr:IclR family transcriptional regulator [Opitutales bacterium]
MPPSTKKYNVPGLDRALSIVELLNSHANGLSVNEIAATLSLPANSVYRIMTTLERRRYIRKKKEGTGYVLTDKLLSMATPVTGDPSLIESSMPYLYKLRDQTMESVLIGTITGKEGVVLEQIEGLHPFSFRVKPGLRFPLHTSAPGKAYLANLSEPKRSKLIHTLYLKRFTKNTITDPKNLLEECVSIGKHGYAVDREEEMEGQVCIGSVVKNGKNNLAGAIWLVAPTNRINHEKIKEFGALLSLATDAISTDLGYLSFKAA